MPRQKKLIDALCFGYEKGSIGESRILQADCFEWFRQVPENTLHGILTDPPYGVKEYDTDQLSKRESGNGGIWRIPPSFDGHVRAPLPRFTALDERERTRLHGFFVEWGRLALHALRPGAHVFIATNSFMAPLLYSALEQGGLTFRGEIIRLVRTLRGGDRPKNAEKEFPGVTSMARGCYEPWGIFRKPLRKGMTVSDCLREFQTGGIRRYPNNLPFEDVIESERTPRKERAIANHPSLKPQSLLRRLAFVILPLGQGIIADPFMGSGSTIAAAEAVGTCAIGIERHNDYFSLALTAVSRLKAVRVPAIDAVLNNNSDQKSLFSIA